MIQILIKTSDAYVPKTLSAADSHQLLQSSEESTLPSSLKQKLQKHWNTESTFIVGTNTLQNCAWETMKDLWEHREPKSAYEPISVLILNTVYQPIDQPEPIVHEVTKLKKIEDPLEFAKNTLYTEDTIPQHLRRYWDKRYTLFSKFDEGIRMDEEGWYSVTPEKLAAHVAERCKCDVIIDAFCGVGGNTIQFAQTCKKVIAFDIDESRLECARHNARIYGVEDRIQFILGNYFDYVSEIEADVVFLSPPWGGPSYREVELFDLISMMPISTKQLFQATSLITKNIALFIPYNSNIGQLLSLPSENQHVEVESEYINNELNSVVAYFGDLAFGHC
ncbi:Trimethylguanosine synthase [Basidiobolus ranarum]|uniref:Trimethylguanosine synthase n=1 Tax=Basidiobolus ranarum TaxID=34480 RepID=A0ABR2WSM9_9FUNG